MLQNPTITKIACLLLLAGVTGCQRTGETAPAAAPALPEENWVACYVDDTKVGYEVTRRELDASGDEPLLVTTKTSEITFRRAGQPITQRGELRTVETAAGEPLRFTNRVEAGPLLMEWSGKWEGGQLLIEATKLGKTETVAIDWKPQYGGLLADEQSLRDDPLEPGEERTLYALFPMANRMARLQLRAGSYEPTKLLDKEAELLRVEHVTFVDNQRVAEQTIWVDKQGGLQKLYLPQLKLTAYRTTREIALAEEPGGSFDLLTSTVVRVNRPLPQPHQTTRIVYRASLPETSIEGVFVTGPTQSVKEIDEHTVDLTVRAVRPDRPKTLPAEDMPPTAADLAPNNLIQSDDERIVAMAHSVAKDEDDPWQIALALEGYVHRIVAKKNFSQAFASAAEVCVSKEGDCTEHSVLLAALCRARGIPARGAMGLVYFPPLKGFAYHMWTEVWTGDRWVPVDATLGKGGIGAAHIKLQHSNLQGADALSAFLPVFRVLGQLRLEILEVN